MTTTPSIYLLERELKGVISALDYLNEGKQDTLEALKDIEQNILDKTRYLKDINKSIEVLKNAKSNT